MKLSLKKEYLYSVLTGGSVCSTLFCSSSFTTSHPKNVETSLTLGSAAAGTFIIVDKILSEKEKTDSFVKTLTKEDYEKIKEKIKTRK